MEFLEKQDEPPKIAFSLLSSCFGWSTKLRFSVIKRKWSGEKRRKEEEEEGRRKGEPLIALFKCLIHVVPSNLKTQQLIKFPPHKDKIYNDPSWGRCKIFGFKLIKHFAQIKML